MADFINTIDALGDNVVADSIIERNITEFRDNVISSIRSNAFNGCYALTTVDLPTVVSFGDFAFRYCASLKTLILRGENLVALSNSVFEYCYHMYGTINTTYNPAGAKDGYIYVPSALVDTYIADSKWSRFSSQFRKLEEWTVDGTVTGDLDPNKHMVRFFNSDGTLLDCQIVTTGESVSYDGIPVCPEDSSIPFGGFKPSPVNITSDIDCYAQYISFATSSWEQIAEISEAGEAENYFKVGDTKTIPLTYSTTTENITVAIAGFNHDDKADGSGKAGISIVYQGFPSVKSSWQHINAGSSVSGNTYDRSNLHKLSTHFNALPRDLQGVIKEVKKEIDKSIVTLDKAWYSNAIGTINAKLWALSLTELGQLGGSGSMNEWAVLGKKYDIFPEIAESSDIGFPFFPGYNVNNLGSDYWVRNVMRSTESNTLTGVDTTVYYIDQRESTQTAQRSTAVKNELKNNKYVLLGFCV